MSEQRQHRLRLRLPSGAEFEAEGSPEFVAGERREFLAQNAPAGRMEGQSAPASVAPAWESIVEPKGSHIQLRTKFRGDKTEKDACLVLLAAAQALLRTPKPTAAQLARWLRTSGYPIGRVDRVLQDALDKGEIMASGSRRARRYELSSPGKVRAYLLANQLTSLVAGSLRQ